MSDSLHRDRAMTVEEIEDAILKLSPDKLDEFRAWFEEFEASRFTQDGFYIATEDELRGIDRGLREADAGNFATAEEVEATFAKHRKP
jgi:predicted transcriptional regulator